MTRTLSPEYLSVRVCGKAIVSISVYQSCEIKTQCMIDW